jgi:hypothetical protein
LKTIQHLVASKAVLLLELMIKISSQTRLDELGEDDFTLPIEIFVRQCKIKIIQGKIKSCPKGQQTKQKEGSQKELQIETSSFHIRNTQ